MRYFPEGRRHRRSEVHDEGRQWDRRGRAGTARELVRRPCLARADSSERPKRCTSRPPTLPNTESSEFGARRLRFPRSRLEIGGRGLPDHGAVGRGAPADRSPSRNVPSA